MKEPTYKKSEDENWTNNQNLIEKERKEKDKSTSFEPFPENSNFLSLNVLQ